jgi:hypothetical protein
MGTALISNGKLRLILVATTTGMCPASGIGRSGLRSLRSTSSRPRLAGWTGRGLPLSSIHFTTLSGNLLRNSSGSKNQVSESKGSRYGRPSVRLVVII